MDKEITTFENGFKFAEEFKKLGEDNDIEVGESSDAPYYVITKKIHPSDNVNFLITSSDAKRSFNMNDAQIVDTNFGIDRTIVSKVPPDPLVFLKLPSRKVVRTTVALRISNFISLPFYFDSIPCCAFMRYVQTIPIVGTVEKSLEKKKGYTTRFQVSVELKAKVSAGIMGCDASLEVSTEFQYEKTVNEEKTEYWKQTLTEGSYIVYQNAIIYAYKWFNYDHSNQENRNLFKLLNTHNPGLKLHLIDNNAYFFVPVNRNDPFTLRYSENVWNPAKYDDLIDFLTQNPSKWTPK
eukprot:gene434-549_t